MLIARDYSKFCIPRDCKKLKGGFCRSCDMKSKHADPVFAKARDKRARAQITRLNADPAFRASLRFGGPKRVQEILASIDLTDDDIEKAIGMAT